jgi:hypothetical protein
VGLLGSSPFTLVGDPATGSLLPVGELTLDGLAGETPAGIGVLESGPIASGNQVGVDAGDISPSVPVTVCGNSAGVLGDASASCGAGGGGTTPSSDSGVDLDTILDIGTDGATDPGAGVDVGVDVGLGGEISTGGIIAPTPPGTDPGTTPGRTDTVGTPGSGTTGTSGIPGTLGLTRAAPAPARPPPSRRCGGRSPAPATCRSPAPAATCWPCSPPGCWPRAPCSCGQLGRRRNGRRWEPVTPPRRPGSKR